MNNQSETKLYIGSLITYDNSIDETDGKNERLDISVYRYSEKLGLLIDSDFKIFSCNWASKFPIEIIGKYRNLHIGFFSYHSNSHKEKPGIRLLNDYILFKELKTKVFWAKSESEYKDIMFDNMNLVKL